LLLGNAKKSMNELLSADQGRVELDPMGSLIDADLGAYYNWKNQQRLSEAEKSSFLAWFEGHGLAVVIGPSVRRDTESSDATSIKKILSWIT
jgi:hypothetical protein